MKTLEEILQEYFNCKHPFKKDGDLSESGLNAYKKLTDLLYDLEALEVIEDADDAVETLDYIIKGVG